MKIQTGKSQDGEQPNEFANFDAGLRKALSVPKAELDRREAEWKKKQEEKKAKRRPVK
jgi:hypothetical protein